MARSATATSFFHTITRVLLLTLLVMGGASCATSSEQVRVLEVPRKYAPPVTSADHEIDLEATNDLRAGQRWVVYSDRANNPTYTLPGGSLIQNRLGFLDQFYVVAEEGEYVHLVQDPHLDHLTLSASPQKFGWIRKDRLLLWPQCLVSERDNVKQKAMILNTVDHLKQVREEDDLTLVRFRKGPEPGAPQADIFSDLYRIFYVYKKTPEAVLLGKVPRLPRREEDRRAEMIGWVPRARLAFWDHRVALEPNWEMDALAERRGGRRAQVFTDVASAQHYRRGDSAAVLWDGDPLGARSNGYKGHYRFPILDVIDHDSALVTVGVIASLGNDREHSSVLPSSTLCDGKGWRNVNVVFIVDATSGMASHFPAITNAIRRSMDRLKSMRHPYCFGAAFYRDYAEEARLLETVPLGKDEPVRQFLRQVKAYDAHDTDAPEAVFYGLRAALQDVGLTGNGTNICVVVGDAGNHHRDDPSQVSAKDVVRLLAQRRCHLLAVQIRHGGQPTYDEFVEQMKRLAQDTAQRLQPTDSGASTLSWSQKGNVYQLSGTQYESWVITPAGSSLTSDTFEHYLDGFINYIEDFHIPLQRRDLPFLDVPLYGRAIYDLLHKKEVSPFQVSLAREHHYQLYTKGVAPLTVEGQQHPLFKRVLLFSRDELARLFADIQRLATVRNSKGDRRVQLVHLWQQILRSRLEDTRSATLNKLPMGEIRTRVFGLFGGTGSFLQNVRLEDLENRYTVSDDDFEKYLKGLEDSAEALAKILNAPFSTYPYQFRSYEEVYYWIDEALIP